MGHSARNVGYDLAISTSDHHAALPPSTDGSASPDDAGGPTGSSRERSPGWYIGMPLVVMLLATIGASVLAAIVEGLGAGTDTRDAIIGIAFSGALLLGGLALRTMSPRTVQREMTGSRISIGQAIGIGVGMGLAFRLLSGIISSIGEAIDPSLCEKAKEATDIIPPEMWQKVLLAISLVMLAPLGEELLFRGHMYRGVAALTRVVPAAVIAGVLFGLAHPQYYVTWSLLLSICLMGVGLCLMYQRWGFVTVVATHLCFNLIPAVLIFTGVDTTDITCTTDAMVTVTGLLT